MSALENISQDDLLVAFTYVITASLAGQWVAAKIPWRVELKRSGLNGAFGLILGPFLVGFISVLILYLPGEKSANFVKYLPVIILSVPAYLYLRFRDWTGKKRKPALKAGTITLRLIWFLFCLALLWSAFFYPLTQNDALEYAIVGRELFLSQSLTSYPPISPSTNESGFYGAWTHPPLYVSMIALSNFIQGHADEPGLMRFIAPWFLIVASHGIWCLGAQISLRCGAIASIILISTPLLFLGADSALVDSLTVSSFVLLTLALYGINFRDAKLIFSASLSLGFTIGIGMWSHSQTILYLPVGLFLMFFLSRNLTNANVIKLGIYTLFFALILRGGPYVNNFIKLGSFISDEPEVFALPILDWQGYFDIARGIDHVVARVQYGLFKGWFSLEAYGFSYWFMTLGLIYILRSKLNIGQIINPNKNLRSSGALLLWVACTLFLCYFVGTLLSMLLGMNLMIKNERYLLTTIPAVALIGGYALDQFVARSCNKFVNQRPVVKDLLLLILFGAKIFIIFIFIVTAVFYRFRYLPKADSQISVSSQGSVVQPNEKNSFLGKSLDYERRFENFSSIGSVEYINDELPGASVILASRPADMYYLNQRMISYLDPRLIKVYNEKDPFKAREMLRDLGISHIHMQNYSLPPFYNSSIGEVISSPSLSELIYDDEFFQIYSLKDNTTRPDPVELTNMTTWGSERNIIFGGRKAFFNLSTSPRKLDPGLISENITPFFHRDYSTSVYPVKTVGDDVVQEDFLRVTPQFEHIFEFELSGNGYLRFWASFYKESNGVLTAHQKLNHKIRFQELVLNTNDKKKKVVRRFIPPEDVDYMLISIEHLGRSKIEIHSAKLLVVADPM